jgi:RNA polymerase sigma-70 factor, ECF subfamily
LEFLVKFAESISNRGSRDNFKQYLLPHAAVIYRAALRLCKTSHGAEDLVQETYYLALKKFDQLKDREKSKYWLFAILRNVFLKEIEKKKNQVEVEFDSVCYSLRNKTHLENEILEDEAKKTVRSALDKLDEKLREPIRLFYFEGRSYQEISSSLKIPIGTVMSRIARAKIRMKRDLVRDGFSFFPQKETHKVF